MQQFFGFSLECPAISLVNIIISWGSFLSIRAFQTQDVGDPGGFWRKMRESISIILHKGASGKSHTVYPIYHKNMNFPCPPGDDSLRIATSLVKLAKKYGSPFHWGKKLPAAFYSGTRCCRSRACSSAVMGRHSPGASALSLIHI